MSAGGVWESGVADMLERARRARRHGVTIHLADQGVDFWCDLTDGVRIARTIFGPYGTLDEVSAPGSRIDGRWRVTSVEVPGLLEAAERLVRALTGPRGAPVPVRRWGGDVPAERYDFGHGRCLVVHRGPLHGLTVFVRGEREIYYLRPCAAFDVPHTEHAIKYPLRVGLRRAGCSQVHAAACWFRGRGLLLMGPRRSGKSTLLMQLMGRGAQLIASDLSFVRREGDGAGRLIAFPQMLRIARGTIDDNETMRESLSRQVRSGDYLRSPVFNAGKEEFYLPVLERIWGRRAVRRTAPLDTILFPALDLDRRCAAGARLSPDETERRILDSLSNDPPILDWLPFMSEAEFDALARASARDVARCAPAAYELRFGPAHTDPGATVERIVA